MDMNERIFFIFFNLILPLIVGYVARRKQWLTILQVQLWVKVNLTAANPLLCLLTLWSLPLYWQYVWLPVLGLLMYIFSGILAYIGLNRRFTSELDRGSYLLSAVMTNSGIMGGLCAYTLFGERGFALTQVIILLQNFAMFLCCFPLAHYFYLKSMGKNFDRKSLYTSLFNWSQISVVGMLIGLGLSAAGLERPVFLNSFIHPLAYIAAWTAMLPVGYAVRGDKMRRYLRGVLPLLPLRFFLVPGLIYLLGRFLFTDHLILSTLLIIAATPTAINTVIAAQLYKLNVDLAATGFLLTTAVFLLVILPLFIGIFF